MASNYGKNSDWILRLDTKGGGEAPPHWLPVLSGFQTLGEARSDTTSAFYYLDGFGSPETGIDGTTRTFSTTGHRIYGDPLQDWLFSFEKQWDLSRRYAGYQYFNSKTGEGEQGTVSISFTSTQSGAPQERAAFGVSIAVQGAPALYRHDLGPYTVAYDPNGGSGSVEDSEEHAIGSNIIVKSADGLTAPAGKAFREWNTSSDATGAHYQPGDILAVLDTVILYAAWAG